MNSDTKVISFTGAYRKRQQELSVIADGVSTMRDNLLIEMRDSTFRSAYYLSEIMKKIYSEEHPSDMHKYALSAFNEMNEVMLALDHLSAIEHHLPVYEESDSLGLKKAFNLPPGDSSDKEIVLFAYRHYLQWSLKMKVDMETICKSLNAVAAGKLSELINESDIQYFIDKFLS